MQKQLRIVLLTLMLMLTVSYVAHAETDLSNRTIGEIVVTFASASEAEFTTLLTAIQLADPAVAQVVNDPTASHTVFAPTDAAFQTLFNALGEATVNSLLADPQTLTSILLFHVAPLAIPGYVLEGVPAQAPLGYATLETLNGQFLDVRVEEGGALTINGVSVITRDILASNGIIHVIDAVLLPETRTLAQWLTASAQAPEAQFTALQSALTQANLLAVLDNPDQAFTVFAPTDDAFRNIPGDVLASIGANPQALADVLTYHVVAGRISVEELEAVRFLGTEYADMPDWFVGTDPDGTVFVRTVNGNLLRIRLNGSTPLASITVNEVNGVQFNIDASNGILHVLEAVVVP